MIERRLDVQYDSNYWFSLGLHIDHTDPSITIHLPFLIVCIGRCKQPGFRYSVRRLLGLGATPYTEPNICECCERSDVFAQPIPDFVDHKGVSYNYLCNRCFVELGGWDDTVEDVTPEQLDQIIGMTERQFEADNAADAIRFTAGLKHYAMRQLFFYYEVVMGGGVVNGRDRKMVYIVNSGIDPPIPKGR